LTPTKNKITERNSRMGKVYLKEKDEEGKQSKRRENK
jgi:hypothetical protein